MINGTWQVPLPQIVFGPPPWITNGWQLGAIYEVGDCTPLLLRSERTEIRRDPVFRSADGAVLCFLFLSTGVSW